MDTVANAGDRKPAGFLARRFDSLTNRSSTAKSARTRAEFFTEGTKALAESGPNVQTTVLTVNIDAFRDVNHHLGYTNGDAILNHVATTLLEIVGPYARAIVGRMGADAAHPGTRTPRAGAGRPAFGEKRPYNPGPRDDNFGNRAEAPRTPRPAGDRPQGDRPPFQNRGPRPQGDRPQGDRPPYQNRGPRPQGDRPQGDRAPYQNRGPRPPRAPDANPAEFRSWYVPEGVTLLQAPVI